MGALRANGVSEEQDYMDFCRVESCTRTDSFFAQLRQLPRTALALAATALMLLGVVAPAGAAAFTPGNIVVYRVGDGVAALGSGGTAVFLDEYTQAGTLVQSIAMPTTGSRLVASGTATTEGFMTRSQDGQYLIVPGYDAALAAASITTSTTVPRVIGRVDSTGAVNATSSYLDSGTGGNIRSATSVDGTRYWTAGSTVGARTVVHGATTATTVSTTATNMRNIAVFSNQLYIGSGAGTVRMATVGSGTPTTSGQTMTQLPGLPTTTATINGYFFADLDGTAGVDTLYLADETANAVQKWTLASGTWTLTGSVAVPSARGLAGSVAGTTVTLFATSGGGGTPVVKITDASGYNVALSGTATTIVATAGTNKAFRGIAFAPAAPATFPTVSSINRVTASPTNAASVDFTVTFSESVTGVDTADFALTTSGVTGASISNVAGSGATYTVTVNSGSGDGTIRLDVTDNDTIINGSLNPLGGAGSGNGNFTTGQSYTFDKTAPLVSSIVRANTNPTSASSVDFTVTFDSAVTGVDSGDFTLVATGVTGTSITNVAGSGTTYTVTATTGTEASGTLRLDANAGASIVDASGNALGAGFTGQTYTIDRNAPNVSSVTRADSNPTKAASRDYTVTFSQSVTGVDATDFTLTTTGGIAGASVSNVAGSGTTYTVTVNTGSGDGTIRLDVANNGSIVSSTNVPLSAPYTSGEVYTIDKTAPTVSSSVRADANTTAATTVHFTVTFSEPVSGVSTGDFSLVTTGVTGASITGLSGSGSTYTVTVNTGSGDGTIHLDVVTGGTIIDAATNLFVTGYTAGETYTIQKTNPAAGVVISQVYGGNGNAYSNDYIELFNTTGTAIPLGGYALHYGSATGQFGSVATNIYTFANGTTIGAHAYLSVKFGTAGSGLPTTTDIDGGATLNMSGTSGKVAFVTSGTALGCGATATPCALPDPRILDIVAYGASNNGEGGQSVNDGTAISASSGPLRKSQGCQDTNNNFNDFTVATTAAGLAPRTAATTHTCPPPNNPPAITAPANPITTVAENAPTFSVGLNGTDDGGIYNWSITPGTGISSATIASGQGTGSITVDVTLQTNFYGTATFTASLSDGYNSPATRLVNITVNRDININHVPAITPPPNPAAFAAQNAAPFNVNLTGSDDNSAYAWSAIAGAGISNVVVTAGQGTPNVTYNVTLQNGFIGTATFTASLSDGVNPPVNQAVNIGVSASGSSVSHVVISQVYGGGGNASATYSNDFVELYNPTGSAVNMAGWTVQYASATNTADWASIAPIGGIIGPGEYFLVGLASGGAVGTALPTPNVTGDLNLSATAGKVALVSNGDPLTGSCGTLITDPDIIDFLGYGTANCSETSVATAPANSQQSMFRASNGNVDTNVNSADFSTGAVSPRRTSPIQELGPAIITVAPNNGNTIAPRDANLVITFSEPVDVAGSFYDINCNTTGNHFSATFAGSGTRTITIIPNVNFAAGETCTAILFKDFIHDSDTDDSGVDTDTPTSNYTWSFTTSSGTAPPYAPSVHLTMGNPSGAVADINVPNNYLMEKPEIAVSYNRDRGTPNWVSWHLSDEWIGSLVRNDTFRADPAVPPTWYRVLGSDYQSSGFDRGHMTPNADRDKETSIPINQATFLMTNMVPQAPDNNQGPWAALENDLRSLLPANELYIVSGPYGTGGSGSNGGTTTTIANGHVTVPASTWKVVLVLPKASGDDVARVTSTTRTIAVNMPNVQGIRSDDWHNYLTTVDAVEALTGYDFFPNVPDAIEASIEGGTNGTNPPGAANESVSTNEDVAKAITLDGVSPTNGALTYTIVSQPSHGALSGSGANITYTPTGNYNGSDTFTYRVNDGTGDSNTATVSITVAEVNDAPVATDDNKSVTGNSSLTFTASDLTANDSTGPSNESTQTLTVTGVTQTAQTNGTVSLNSGQVTYTPTVGFVGAASFTYTVCDNGLTAGASDSQCTTGTVNVNVQPPVASHFSVSAPANVTNGTPFNVTVTALDASNAVVTGYTGTVHFTSSSAGTLPSDYTFTGGDSGAHTFSVTLTTDGAQTITATDTVTASITGTANTSVVTPPPPATHFSVSAPSNVTNGTPFNVTVTALDASNATVTGYTGTVHFTSSSAGTLPSDYTFTGGDSGAHTFSVTLTTNGSQSITATDTVTASITGTTNTTVDPFVAAIHFSVTMPATVTAGTPFNVTVTALDPSNNVATTYSGMVGFTSSSAGTLPANYIFDSQTDAGTHTFSVTLTDAGLQTITAKDVEQTVFTGTGSTTVVKPATHFSVTAPASVTQGVAFNVTVTAQNVDNATATTYAGTVHFTSTSAGTLPIDYTFLPGDNGTKTFSVTLTSTGAQSITATDTVTPSITGSANTTVNAPAPVATQFDVTAPATVTAGTPFNITVTAVDNAHTVVTSYTGTVHFTSSSTGTLPIDYTFVPGDNGTHTFSVTLTSTGSRTITATDTVTASITGTATTTVNAATTHFSVTAPANVTTGTPFNVTVTALDATNTQVLTYTGTVHFTSSSSGTLPADYTFDLGDNGSATVSVTLTSNGAQSVTATDTVTPSINGSANINVVTPAAVTTHFSVTAPANVTSGVPFTFTVTALDASNAIVPAYTGTVHFTSSTAGTLPADYTFVAGDNGTHTFSATLSTTGSATVTATDTVNASINGSATTTVVPNPQAATHFSVTAPATVTYGVPFNVTVTALDATNTLVTTFTGTVHFTSSSTGTLPADYTFDLGDNGAHTFSVTLTSLGTQSITVTSGAINGSTTTNVGCPAPPPGPLPSTINAPARACANATGVVASAPFAGTWTVTNGTITSGQGTSSITFTAGSTGVVSISVVATAPATPCSISNGSTTVIIDPRPTATLSAPSTICAGSAARIAVTLTGTAPFHVQWSDGLTQDSSTATFTRTVTPSANTTYRISSVSDAHCNSGGPSNDARILVNHAPELTLQPEPVQIVAGQTAVLKVLASGTNNTFQWFRGETGDRLEPVGINSSVFTTPALSQTTRYWVLVTNGCGETSSHTLVVAVIGGGRRRVADH
jgi:DNA/RNA endonuclease G (NUC1)